MSELEIVYVVLIVMCAIAATLARLWLCARGELELKSAQLENLEFARAYFEKDRDSYRDGYARLTRYAHVRKIAANIISGTARKK